MSDLKRSVEAIQEDTVSNPGGSWIGDATPVYEYERGTWGPSEADSLIESDGGWFDPPPPRGL